MVLEVREPRVDLALDDGRVFRIIVVAGYRHAYGSLSPLRGQFRVGIGPSLPLFDSPDETGHLLGVFLDEVVAEPVERETR